MNIRLDDKLVWVTGGSRGIGEAIARGCAEAGARVVLTSRTLSAVQAAADAINADYPNMAYGYECHAGDVDAIDATAERIATELGVPDVLFNNAATNPYFGPLLNTPASMWDKTFQVNVRGYFETTRQVAQRLLAEDRPGTIINIASIQGNRAAPLQGVYGMTKAAVISMTRTLAVELGRARIRVNAIAPGLVDTRFASALVQNEPAVKQYTDRAALGRYGTPAELTGLAVYLASDEAAYVTGQVFTVDGGYTAT
ncbi:MAG: NAD(P)-dependent dehydrogenase (short-subunit alcohol dehydrogenase family) [Bradymonadia bacterium]|jgi:NAD(P)-dependent dehydrogenase (short-subunit alcohol dehydrogenase family)